MGINLKKTDYITLYEINDIVFRFQRKGKLC